VIYNLPEIATHFLVIHHSSLYRNSFRYRSTYQL